MAKAVELTDGTRISVGDGSVDAVRTFFFDGYADELAVIRGGFGSTVTQIGSSLNTVKVPRLRDKHPLFQQLYAYKYDLTKESGGSDQWRATFYYRRYQPIQRTDSSGLSLGPETVDFVDVSARCTGSFTDVYRANVAIPSDGDPSEADIGGDPVDAGGVPTSVMRTQYELTVNVTKNGDSLTGFSESVGKRCTNDVIGLDGAATIYKGAAIQRIGTNLFSVSHTFLFDSHYHLIQAPDYLPDGQPDLGTDPDDPSTLGHFKNVRHVQPFEQASIDPAGYIPTDTGIS